MMNIGAKIINFSLPATDGNTYTIETFKDKKILVVYFTSNHCPYVKGSDEKTRSTVEKFQNQGVGFVGINSNSVLIKPDDSFEKMKERMEENKFPWVYLYDEAQTVAKSYNATRTPEFFVFNDERKLCYHGRAIDNPREWEKSTTNELENAIEKILKGEKPEVEETSAVGCTIKWKPEETQDDGSGDFCDRVAK